MGRVQSSKHQAPEKHQSSNTNLHRSGDWSLVLEVSLKLGAWCLELPTPVGAGHAAQSRTIFPEFPDFISSKPSRKSVWEKRWVMIGEISSPLWISAVILYQ